MPGNDELMKKLKFRNYSPRTEDLKKYVEETGAVDDELQKRIEEQKAVIDAANAKFSDPSTDLENMAPKKANWDLKRQLAPKLERLQKKTQKSLLEIVRERAVQGGTGQQLASAVAHAPDALSDEDD